MDDEEVELPLVAGAHTPCQVVLTDRKGKELSSYSHSLSKKNPKQTQPSPKKQEQGLALGDMSISSICWFTHTQINHTHCLKGDDYF